MFGIQISQNPLDYAWAGGMAFLGYYALPGLLQDYPIITSVVTLGNNISYQSARYLVAGISMSQCLLNSEGKPIIRYGL